MRSLLTSALTVAALAAASTATALAPPLPRCERAGLSQEEAVFDGYDYVMFGDGFTYYERWLTDGGRWEFIMEHCPTRERLSVIVEASDATDNRQRINDVTGPILDAMRSTRSYTLRDLQHSVREQGIADATVGMTNSTSCVCAAMGY